MPQVSIVVSMFNKEDFIDECLESIVSQDYFDMIEVIVVDDGSTDDSYCRASKYSEKFKNILLVQQPNQGVSSARNTGIELSTGKYIIFCDADDLLSDRAISSLVSVAEQNMLDIVIGQIEYTPKKKKLGFQNDVNYGFIRKTDNLYPEYLRNYFVGNKLFRKEFLRDKEFSFKIDSLIDDVESILPLLMCTDNIGFISDTVYFYRKNSKNMTLTRKKVTNPEYYSSFLDFNKKMISKLKFTLEKSEKEHIQIFLAITYSELLNRLRNNLSYFSKEFLYSIFLKIRNTYSEIENEYILSYLLNSPTQIMWLAVFENNFDWFYNQKIFGNSLVVKDKTLYANCRQSNSTPIELAKVSIICILRDIRLDNNKTIILTYKLSSSRFSLNKTPQNKIFVHLNPTNNRKLNREYSVEYTSCEGEDLLFEAKIPLKDLVKCNGEAKFLIKIWDYEDNDFVYRRSYCFTNMNRKRGRIFQNSNKIIYFDSEACTDYWVHGKYEIRLEIVRNSKSNRLKYQISKIRKIKQPYLKILRLAYWLTRIFFKNKNIVLIGERTDTFQDNSSHLFKYIRTKQPDFPAYYLIKKSSPKYRAVKKYGNVLNSGSLLSDLYILNSKVVVNSYDMDSYMSPHGLNKRTNYEAFGDLLNYKRFFLQHGVTYNNVSSALSYYNVGFDKIVINSSKEEQFFEEKCHYNNEQLIKTGFPRFPRLINENKKRKLNSTSAKTILVAPTWRRDLVIPSYLKKKKSMNNQFLSSEYYRFFNTLLTDDVLQNKLEANNIILKFLVHYEMEPYLHLFDKTSNQIQYVKQSDHDLQDLMIEADLLVTDYSSIFFDFLMMEKPVIFAQFDYEQFYSIHYKKGYLDFTKNELGIMCRTHSEVVTEIIKNIDQKFKYPDILKKNRYKYLNYAIDTDDARQAIFEEIAGMISNSNRS